MWQLIIQLLLAADPVLSQVSIPSSSSTVSVSIIDSTFTMRNYSISTIAGPPIPGHEAIVFGEYTFLITHPVLNQSILFDLGPAKDFANDYPPTQAESLLKRNASGTLLSMPKYISEVLTDGGVELESIDAVIWSHWHWDHIGRPSLFPASTKLVFGEGLLEQYGMGYPANETSPYLARELEGRQLVGIPFPPDALKIGGFESYDYFGDGSFYLLHTPGHAKYMMSGLARVTCNPDSFILMGTDTYHHASQLRPSPNVPLPDLITLSPAPPNFLNPIAASILEAIHPARNQSALPPYAANLTSTTTTPFRTAADGNRSSALPIPDDGAVARDVICKVQAFDADERVLTVGAHEWSLLGVLELWPETADGWREKGWKERGRWAFVGDFADAIE